MKTKLVTLIGDPLDNLRQLGMQEKAAFEVLETRILLLVSQSSILRQGQDLAKRVKGLFAKKKELTFFETCIEAYCEGLGIAPPRYHHLLELFELAAHYGQIYPELKSILPGCTSVFAKGPEGVTHSRLLDFPLTGIFEETTRLYYWKPEGRAALLTYSCEGLAPLFFHTIHESGLSLALHHKPSHTYQSEGEGIFHIVFETLFKAQTMLDLRKLLKKRNSVTKWSLLLTDKVGTVQVIDVEGPSQKTETYSLTEHPQLIFTNIPLQNTEKGFEHYLEFSYQRQVWCKERLTKKSKSHLLDRLTDVSDQDQKNWFHPAATLTTVGALSVNLTHGHLDLKTGQGALVASDAIERYALGQGKTPSVFKEAKEPTEFEMAWKRASKAQSYFDQEKFDLAYHELQMSISLMPNGLWKEILNFYLCTWDFKFISNQRELSHVYKRARALRLPPSLRDQWIFLLMRLEKKLGLQTTHPEKQVSEPMRRFYVQERDSSKPVFATWMKLLYPRIDILDVMAPHHR